MNMTAKRKYKLSKFLEVLSLRSVSTGVIARKIKCAQSTALRYLRELKASKQVIERRVSNTINLWKITGKRILLIDVDSKIPNLALMKISTWHKIVNDGEIDAVRVGYSDAKKIFRRNTAKSLFIDLKCPNCKKEFEWEVKT